VLLLDETPEKPSDCGNPDIEDASMRFQKALVRMDAEAGWPSAFASVAG
jgi:hypothetical protein